MDKWRDSCYNNPNYTQKMEAPAGGGGGTMEMHTVRKEIMGVSFDDVTLEEAVAAGEKLAAGQGFSYVVTPNPEIVNMARQAVNMEPANYEYRRLLEQLQYGATQYQQFGRGFQMPSMDMSKLCLCLCGARICFPYCFFFPC